MVGPDSIANAASISLFRLDLSPFLAIRPSNSITPRTYRSVCLLELLKTLCDSNNVRNGIYECSINLHSPEHSCAILLSKMLLNTLLLILGNTRLIHSNALAVHPTPTPDLYAGLDQSVLTNAERLQLGLSPLKPRQLWKADRVQRRQAENSGSPSVSESGFLYAVQSDGTSTGCVISDGTWYVGGELRDSTNLDDGLKAGTCATYKQVLSGDSATFSRSKGPCEITSGTFSCASGNTATIFVMVSGFTLPLTTADG